MGERIELSEAKKQIDNAFAYCLDNCRGDNLPGARAAHARVAAFLAQCEAERSNSLSDATVEALVAELRHLLSSMKPGSRLDVFDAVTGGYCIHCGDAVKDVCHCENDE